eukprot:UN06845
MAAEVKLEMGARDAQAQALKKHNYRASRRDLTAQDSVRDEGADERDEEVEAGKKFIDFFGRLIPFLYGLFAIGILRMGSTGFISKDLKE